MSLPVKTGLPDGMEIAGGYTLQWRAADPTTGADVAGVVISAVSVYGTPLTPAAARETGPYELIPGPVEAV